MNEIDFEIIDVLLRMTSGEENVLENIEKEGQQELIRRTMLPKKMHPEKEVWEELGFSFEEIADDDLMYQGTLPDGWNIQGTEHHMWTELLDKDQNVRGTIFYKASAYDRKAFMSLKQKYDIKQETNSNSNSVKYTFYFGNDEERLYSSHEIEVYDDDYEKRPELFDMIIDTAKEDVKNFADKNYPGWDSVKNYWSKEKNKVKVKVKE